MQTQELKTAGEIQGDATLLQSRVAELQDEVLRLRMSKRLSTSALTSHYSTSVESESECDEDLDAQLTLTESALFANLDALANDVTSEDPFFSSLSRHDDADPSSAFTVSDTDALTSSSYNDETLKRSKHKQRSREQTADDAERTPRAKHVTSSTDLDLDRTPTRADAQSMRRTDCDATSTNSGESVEEVLMSNGGSTLASEKSVSGIQPLTQNSAESVQVCESDNASS